MQQARRDHGNSPHWRVQALRTARCVGRAWALKSLGPRRSSSRSGEGARDYGEDLSTSDSSHYMRRPDSSSDINAGVTTSTPAVPRCSCPRKWWMSDLCVTTCITSHLQGSYIDTYAPRSNKMFLPQEVVDEMVAQAKGISPAQGTQVCLECKECTRGEDMLLPEQSCVHR